MIVARFTVHGQPVPQGSKSAIRVGARTVIVDQNRAKLKPWRAQLADAAAAAMNGRGVAVGPVGIVLDLYFQRPKAHYRRSGELREDAPEYVTTRPDGDKVARAVADALTGVVYRDDSQVAEWVIGKRYGDPPRAMVTVSML